MEEHKENETCEKKAKEEEKMLQEQQDSITPLDQSKEKVKENTMNNEKTGDLKPPIVYGDTTNSDKDSKSKKKDKKNSRISLKNKSELFKRIVDIAFECETLQSELQVLSSKNDSLREKCTKIEEENKMLVQRLKEGEALYKEKLDEVSRLEDDIAQRNEVINIVKADKNESAQEYKNALAASLKTYYTDFIELKAMGTSDDVGLAVIETFEGVLKVLEKHGVVIEK